MGSFVVEGGHRLSGVIRPQGAKNEALEVICAVLLTKDEVTISNIPEILDIKNLILLLEALGVKVRRIEKGVFSFRADEIDEESGKPVPVVLGITVKNTEDTTRAKAYDIDEAVKKFAARPGRRVADPAKAAEREEAKRITQERRDANLAILRAWIAQHGLGEGMTATQIHAEVPEFEQLLVLQVGSLLTMLVKEGELTFTMDGKRHKIYSVAK